MSTIYTDHDTYKERELVKNWAAEYAKRECGRFRTSLADHAADGVIDHPDGSITTAKLADGSVTADKIGEDFRSNIKLEFEAVKADTAKAQSTADAAVSKADNAQQTADKGVTAAAVAQASAEAAQSSADAEVTLEKLADEVKNSFALKPASITQLGGIKLHSGSNTNRSGIVVSADGTAYVNTKTERGITRDGAGQIQINPATDAEINAGEDAYKPLTSKTFSRFINYSTVPQRVGTWIDGTPVWRIAIDRALTESEKERMSYDLANDIPIPIYDILLINSFMSIRSDDGCTIWILRGSEPLYYEIDEAVELVNPYHITGWVEFATAEENLNI